MRSLLAGLVIALTQTPAFAQSSPIEQGFLVSGSVRQGLAEQDFAEYVSERGLEVTSPLPGSDVKQVTLDGVQYWLAFCGGRLTYASWLLDDNATFIKSMDNRINHLGFRATSVDVSSTYSDTAQKDANTFTVRLERDGAPYSVTYTLFDENGQVTLEDSQYDNSYGCHGDPRN